MNSYYNTKTLGYMILKVKEAVWWVTFEETKIVEAFYDKATLQSLKGCYLGKEDPSQLTIFMN